MDCGWEVACEFLEFMKDSDFAAGVLAKTLGQFGDKTAGVLGAVAWLLREHGEKIIAAAGFSFGFYRWWLYREHILHKRLDKYLHESDRRLRRAQDDVLRCIERPGPRQALPALPLFSAPELRSVLRERRWGLAPAGAAVEMSAQWQLERAIEKTERRLKAGQDMMASLHTQLASAHVMRGAIAASIKRETSLDANSHVALTAFRSALQVPGHERNIKAKEYEAHQLRRMAHYPQALAAYQELERIAASEGDYRSQRLTQARAKRYQAEAMVARTKVVDGAGRVNFQVPQAAWTLISPQVESSAQDIRRNFAPYQYWDLIEQGDLHLLTAYFAGIKAFVQIEPQEITKAEVCYENALRQTLPRSWRRREKNKLRRAAQDGLDLITSAKRGYYQNHWLIKRS